LINKSIDDFLLTNDKLNQVENELTDIWQLKDRKKEVFKKCNQHLTSSLEYTNNQQEKKSKKSKKKNKDALSHLISHEWLIFSLVLDRFFFYIFITLTILSYLTTLYIFPTLIQMDKNESMIKVY
jgi:hypothetical protein